jgi:hypothetical protein
MGKNENHWITIKLIGGPKSPRGAIGSKVFLTSGGARGAEMRIWGGNSASNRPPKLYFMICERYHTFDK